MPRVTSDCSSDQKCRYFIQQQLLKPGLEEKKTLKNMNCQDEKKLL